MHIDTYIFIHMYKYTHTQILIWVCVCVIPSTEFQGHVVALTYPNVLTSCLSLSFPLLTASDQYLLGVKNKLGGGLALCWYRVHLQTAMVSMALSWCINHNSVLISTSPKSKSLLVQKNIVSRDQVYLCLRVNPQIAVAQTRQQVIFLTLKKTRAAKTASSGMQPGSTVLIDDSTLLLHQKRLQLFLLA